MFPFWKVAIEPLLRAADAKRIVEIGALAGENTELLLDAMGADAELHVIDPMPQFDPDEHRRRFGGRYVFHRDISHNVLPRLDPMDAALIDGDHNWYTVYHELKQLAEVADRAGRRLPIMLLHDTYWPYGRRDLYYTPERIPAEFRQPFQHRGMRPGRRKLVPRGGLNPQMANAEVEGGERNGVLTAVEDFAAEFERPLRRLDLPIYFGLTILVEEADLVDNAELRSVLAHLESSEGRYELLELAEEVRLKAMLYQHAVVFNQEERAGRAAKRYLATVGAALLNEHYPDNELRIEYLQDRISKNLEVDEAAMRDPERRMQSAKRELAAARRSGSRRGYAYAMSRVGLDMLESTLTSTLALHTPGDLVDIGVGRGGTSIFLTAYLEAHEIGDRTVWVSDRFEADREAGGGADLNTVRDGFDRFNLLDDRVRFLQGPPRDALNEPALTHIALARVGDVDPGEVAELVTWLVPRVQIGGSIIIDASPVATQHARFALNEAGLSDEIDVDDGNTLRWTKRVVTEVADVVWPPPVVPLASPSTSEAIDLSIIIVIYNMKREAARSLRSMSRSYQLDVEDVSYEVIVVDNGSDADQRLTEAEVANFGSEFRLMEMGDDATSSPVPALVAGMNSARGRAFAFMIDGAHVLTPRVIAEGLRGLEAYAPSIVMTQQWYVGPGQQNDLMLEGYDETYEDELFVQIDWPSDGYRLFEIGSFVGDRDWFDGMWESNCLFASRGLVAQVGAFDERFDVAGGGYANLDLYERLGSDPATTVVSILGEGSFHQTHGGTTTNQAEILERGRRLIDYRESYEDLRGRKFQGPGKAIHYVGNLYGNAKRTKPRRLKAPLFAQARHKASTETVPIPDEVRTGFTESFWNSAGWRESTWRGEPLRRNPADLWVYQEIIAATRPEVILEVRALVDEPGLARYLADIAPLIGGPRISSLGTTAPDRVDGDSVQWLVAPGRTYEPDAVTMVERAIDGASVLLILGRGRRLETTMAFDAYQHLVPQGSYVIVEDTVLNGYPAEPEFGPGPREAVKTILRLNGDFIPDPAMERFGLTFNPDGYLLRRSGP